MDRIIYLACPYTHSDSSVRAQRVALATKVARLYVNLGLVVYSPLTLTAPLDEGNQPHEFWMKFNEPFMAICTEMIIIQTDGWMESKGIVREIQYFKKAKKHISFFLPEFIGEE